MTTTDPRTPTRRARQRGGWTVRHVHEALRAAQPPSTIGYGTLYRIDVGHRVPTRAERAEIRDALARLARRAKGLSA